MSSLVQRCWLGDGSSVVVRHTTDRDWLAREPGLIDQESTLMELLTEARLDGHRLTAPTHLASEPEAGLLHRDLHPLNVLWSDGEITGVIDWVNACIGHPHAELGHCRWNLAVLAGQEAADEFLDCYLGAIGFEGESYDPWWDLASVLGLLPGPLGVSGWSAVGRTDLTLDTVVQASEAFLSDAVSAALRK